MPRSTQDTNTTTSNPSLFMALELSGKTWKLGFLTEVGNPRIRTIGAGDLKQLEAEIGKAKRRFKLAENAAVRSAAP